MQISFGYRSLSLSGIPLEGNRIVRTIYLDESGTGLKNDPVAVVCGVIIDADHQWQPIEDYLKDLVQELVPAEFRAGFVFHAKDLCGGCFGKNKEHRAAAREALRRILRIPWEFGIAVSFGFYFKTSHQFDNEEALERVRLHHQMAYCFCAVGCEKYMRESARPNEIATMVAENTNEAKLAIKDLHAMLQGRTTGKFADVIFRGISEAKENLPIRRIKDTVHLAEKNEALFLQLADAFGYVFRGFLAGRHKTDKYFQEYVNELLIDPENFEHLRERPAGARLIRPSP